MDLSYIVHSERCALLLDGDGVCRWVVPKVDATDIMVVAARRCIGARFVATLDRETPGFMGHEPRVGTNLLFALVTGGRIALARFGPVTSFEQLDASSKAAFTARESAVCAVPSSGLDAADEDDACGSQPDVSEPSSASIPAEAPELDDVLASLARDAIAGVEEKPAAPPTEASHALETTPLRPDASGEIDIVTGSFARASERSLDVEDDEGESELDALMRMVPAPPANVDAVDGSLEPVTALTQATGEPDQGPDDSQIHAITTVFTRSEQLAVLLGARELDIELDSSSFARDMSRDADGGPLTTEPETETESTRFRPSGIVMRRTPELDEAAPAPSVEVEPSLATDDETRRFSRAAGDLPYEELFQPSRLDTPRRGMLPRR